MKKKAQYVIVRGDRSSSFAGYLESRNGREVTLTNARRLWFWSGAASLSQLAMSGTSKPKQCKFPAPVDRITILDALEIIDCTDAALASLNEVPEWKE